MHPVLQLLPPLSPDVRCVGVDVAKEKFDVRIDNAKKSFTVANTPGGRDKLIQRLKGLTLASIVVESSGGYERPLLFDLLDAGLPVAHVNPRIVRDYAGGSTSRPRPMPWTPPCWPVMAANASPGLWEPRIRSGICSRTSTAAAGNCSNRSPP